MNATGRFFAKLWLNTWLFFAFLNFTLLYTPTLVLLIVLGSFFVSRRETMRRFRRAISWYGAVIVFYLPLPFLRVLYRDFGTDDTEDTGPYIVICNHRSSSDPFLMACLPYEVIQVVNVWPFRLPFLGSFARWAGYLSVNEMPSEKFMDACEKYLAEGVSIAVFPEGTRSGSCQMGQFHSAIFRVAQRAQKPIIPLCIAGNEDKPPKGSVLLTPGMVKIHKLRAIRPQEFNSMTAFQLKNMVRDIISEETTRMDAS